MISELMSPKQKEIFEEYIASCNEELELKKRQRDLLKQWRSLSIQQGMKKLRSVSKAGKDEGEV